MGSATLPKNERPTAMERPGARCFQGRDSGASWQSQNGSGERRAAKLLSSERQPLRVWYCGLVPVNAPSYAAAKLYAPRFSSVDVGDQRPVSTPGLSVLREL